MLEMSGPELGIGESLEGHSQGDLQCQDLNHAKYVHMLLAHANPCSTS